MGAEPLALLGALLLLLALECAMDIESLFPLLFCFSDSGEGKYPESLLSEESTAEVVKVFSRSYFALSNRGRMKAAVKRPVDTIAWLHN